MGRLTPQGQLNTCYTQDSSMEMGQRQQLDDENHIHTTTIALPLWSTLV
jgi:hypothetical protein